MEGSPGSQVGAWVVPGSGPEEVDVEVVVLVVQPDVDVEDVPMDPGAPVDEDPVVGGGPVVVPAEPELELTGGASVPGGTSAADEPWLSP